MARSIAAVWIIAELLAYALFLSHFSILAALFIGIGSTLAGLVTLRALGRRITREAAAEMMGLTIAKDLSSLPLALVGALLLLLPGFLSNAVGLALVIAGARSLLRRDGSRTRDGQYVDLDRSEWTRQPDEPPR